MGTPGGKFSESFGALQPKVTLRYTVNDELNVFAAWGKGFRSGQFNQNGTAQLVGNANDVAREENTETFELGFKSRLADNRVTLNGTVWKTDVTDSHYFLFIGELTSQVMVNIDAVDLWGFDLEASVNIAEGFHVNAGFGYVDSEIKAYAFRPGDVGNKTPYIAETTLNLSAQYRTPITDDLEALARVDYNRIGDRYWDPENTTANSPIDLINARVAVESLSGGWTISFYGKNLLDTAWTPDVTADGGAIFTYLAPPRVWGADVRFNF